MNSSFPAGPMGAVAKDFFQFSIYDGRKNHIVSLRLRRTENLSIGDMEQLQNFLWTQLGIAIREDLTLQRRLRYGGVEVILEDPNASFKQASG